MHGIVRILMDLPELVGVDRELGLRDLVAAANEQFGGGGGAANDDAVVAFAHERVRYALEQRGFRARWSAARFWRQATWCRCARCAWRRRCSGCVARKTSRRWPSLFKRVKNIARELKAHAPLDRAALTEPAELALLAELDARRPRIEQAARRRTIARRSPISPGCGRSSIGSSRKCSSWPRTRG